MVIANVAAVVAWTADAHLRKPGADRHIVQLYREEGFRTRAAAMWLGESLRQGGSALVAATPAAVRLLLAQLTHDHLDVERAMASGRLRILDAHEVLAAIMVGEQPIASRFKPLLRDAIQTLRAGAAAPEVRVWGEMVDVLCKKGAPDAARQLETLWNEVIDEEGIRLLCSYEIDHLDPAAHDALESACAGHSMLIPEEDHSALEAAVANALVEVFGEARAPLVRAEWSTGRMFATAMPPAAALLHRAQQRDPVAGAKLLASVRRHLALA